MSESGQTSLRDRFESWLAAYGAAWEGKDTRAFVAGFTEDADYHWTPFGQPEKGHGGIAAAFDTATATQSDIRFTWQVLAADGDTGIAHWRCELTRIATGQRVTIDGILTARFGDDESALVKRAGLKVTEVSGIRKRDTMEVAGWVAR